LGFSHSFLPLYGIAGIDIGFGFLPYAMGLEGGLSLGLLPLCGFADSVTGLEGIMNNGLFVGLGFMIQF
jgi:hypothetical protein